MTLPKFGMHDTTEDAWMFTCTNTRFPPSGAGKYLVGLITDCMQLRMFDLLRMLLSTYITSPNRVFSRFWLLVDLVVAPFRVFEPNWFRAIAAPMLGVIPKGFL